VFSQLTTFSSTFTGGKVLELQINVKICGGLVTSSYAPYKYVFVETRLVVTSKGWRQRWWWWEGSLAWVTEVFPRTKGTRNTRDRGDDSTRVRGVQAY
jgi:hypothetical protein